jgi:gluconate 2-dehydrogenase gamma chain
MNLDRRQLLTYAIGLVGGGVALTALGGLTPGSAEAESGTYFSASRRALLDEVADLMIPATDTPGASGAGVPEYIDKMMARWASQDTKKAFDAVLDAIDAQAAAAHGKAFLALQADQRLGILTQYDAANLTGDLRSMTGGYARFKELVMTAYYLSEIGATQELRLVEVPGPFRGDIPVSDVGRSWAY